MGHKGVVRDSGEKNELTCRTFVTDIFLLTSLTTRQACFNYNFKWALNENRDSTKIKNREGRGEK
jgi:hypothetical protein